MVEINHNARVAAALAALALIGALIGRKPAMDALNRLVVPAALGVIVIGNLIPGLIFGWFSQHLGLEVAMLAHAGGHLLAVAVAG